MKKFSLLDKILGYIIFAGGLAGSVVGTAWMFSIFYYPALFCTSASVFFVLMLSGLHIDSAINGMYENWGFGIFYFIIPGGMLYAISFVGLHVAKWIGVIHFEVNWIALSIVGVGSVTLSIMGGTIWLLHIARNERKMLARINTIKIAKSK